MIDGGDTVQSFIIKLLNTEASMSLFDALVALILGAKPKYDYVEEESEQAGILDEMNSSLKGIDAKLEKVDDQLKEIGIAIRNKN